MIEKSAFIHPIASTSLWFFSDLVKDYSSTSLGAILAIFYLAEFFTFVMIFWQPRVKGQRPGGENWQCNLEMGPDPTQAYFWPAVNSRTACPWPGYFLTWPHEIFFNPKEKNWKIGKFSKFISGWPDTTWVKTFLPGPITRLQSLKSNSQWSIVRLQQLLTYF